MNIPEPDIDYESVKKGEVGELVYSKTGFLKKSKWIIKDKSGRCWIFESYDAGRLAELILKQKEKQK